MMRLVYLTANAAWVFTFGDDLLRMGDGAMFFQTRAAAVAAAAERGLSVSRTGEVSAWERASFTLNRYSLARAVEHLDSGRLS